MSQADQDFDDAMWNAMDDSQDRGEEPVEIAFDAVKAETDAAWLLVLGRDEVWIPKSQAENVRMERTRFGRRHGTMELPEWLAEEKGLA